MQHYSSHSLERSYTHVESADKNYAYWVNINYPMPNISYATEKRLKNKLLEVCQGACEDGGDNVVWSKTAYLNSLSL